MTTVDNRLPTEGTQIDIESRLAAIETALASLTSDTTGQSIATAITGLSGAISPAASNVTYDNTDSTLSASNVKAALDELDDKKVSKAGDTMTGDLNINVTNAKTKYINPNMTLDTSANNGLSSDSGYGAYFTDKNGNAVGDISMTARSTGTNYVQLMARNKKTDGTAVSNYIDVIITKDGSSVYYVSNPEAFRSAIGAQGNISSNTTTVTLSTSKYGTFYYADTTPTVSTSRIISIVVTSSGGNNFADCIMTASGVIRVFGDYSGGNVTIKYFYV